MTAFFEDHLGLDAVVAYSDGEMGLLAYQRAAAHVSRCPSCAAEVDEQTGARQLLREAGAPRIPAGLLESLRCIPVASPVPPPVAGVLGDAQTSGAVRVKDHAHDVHRNVNRDVTRGGVNRDLRRDPAHSQRSRGFRLGAGAIVAGLAVSALAAAAVSEPSRTALRPNPVTGTVQVTSLLGGITSVVHQVSYQGR